MNNMTMKQYMVSIVWVKETSTGVSVKNQIYNKVSEYPSTVLGNALNESKDLIGDGYKLATYVVQNTTNNEIVLNSYD